MLLLCQILREARLLNALSLIQKNRSLIVPLLRPWSVSLLHSKAASGTEQKSIGLNHGKVEIAGTRRQPTSSEAPNKRWSHIRLAADALFANTAGGSFGAKFDAFVDEILPDCSIGDFSNFVRVAGKKSRDNTALHLTRRLPDIAIKLESLASSAWTFKAISFTIYGMQSCNESNDGYLRIMMTMSRIVTRTVLRKEDISSQNLSMLLYGLRSNKFRESESKQMLSCLHKIVEKCTEPLSAQTVGNALYGLQGMSSDDADVQLLVRALTGQVERCTEPLKSQAVGNALYGLQGMSSDDPDVRLLVRAMIDHVQRCTEPLTAQ